MQNGHVILVYLPTIATGYSLKKEMNQNNTKLYFFVIIFTSILSKFEESLKFPTGAGLVHSARQTEDRQLSVTLTVATDGIKNNVFSALELSRVSDSERWLHFGAGLPFFDSTEADFSQSSNHFLPTSEHTWARRYSRVWQRSLNERIQSLYNGSQTNNNAAVVLPIVSDRSRCGAVLTCGCSAAFFTNSCLEFQWWLKKGNTLRLAYPHQEHKNVYDTNFPVRCL